MNPSCVELRFMNRTTLREFEGLLMDRISQLNWLINQLDPFMPLPDTAEEKWRLFRALVNLHKPEQFSDTFLKLQDAFLQNEIRAKGITEIDSLKSVRDHMYLWRGDITTLRVDAIVNAANSGLTGCYYPNHGCIDNAIHTYAGVQLRYACSRIMQKQGYSELVGQAKITEAYNLPSRYILHTVGPIVHGRLLESDREQLVACYRSCLKLAESNGVKSIAFCCISTGEYHFPNKDAAEIAVRTVREFSSQDMKVVFNVFKQLDEELYENLL